MKTIGWSLVVGAVIGIIAFILFGMLEKKGPNRRFQVHYSLQLQTKDSNSPQGSALVVETEKVLRRRFETAEQTFESIHRSNPGAGEQLLDITVGNVADTTGMNELVRSPGRLQFWETFNADEILPVLQTVDSVAREMFPPKIKEEKKDNHKRDQMAPEVRQLLDSMEVSDAEISMKEVGIKKFINNQFIYAGGPGRVKVSDTAILGKILRSEKVVRAMPFGTRLLYGFYPDKNEYLHLYVINTRGRETSLLENRHVADARHEFNAVTSKPQIYFDFTRVGAREWYAFTEKNTGRAIALVVDERVISAPVVETAIEGGSTVISGDFSVQDTWIIAGKMRTLVLPGRVDILKSRVTSQKGIWNPRHILLAILAFGVASVLTWFVFKALKST